MSDRQTGGPRREPTQISETPAWPVFIGQAEALVDDLRRRGDVLGLDQLRRAVGCEGLL